MATRNLYLLEDDADLRSLAARVLSGLPSVEVLEFDRAETALSRLPTLAPTLVIADLELPGMSGVEFISRARLVCPRVPVLVTTGSRSRFDRQLRCLSFVEIWEKPFSIQDLRDRAREVLKAEAASGPAAFTPFGVIDYLQMASFGNRDLVLQVWLSDGRTGRLEIVGGEIWSCQLAELRDLVALKEILEHPAARVEFFPLTDIPNEREITSSTCQVLLELAVAQDEE